MNKINERINKNNDLVYDLSNFFEDNVLFFTEKMMKQSGSHFLWAEVLPNEYDDYWSKRYDYMLGKTVYFWNDGYDDYNFLYAIKHCAKPIEDGYPTNIIITDYIYEDLKMIKGVDNICSKDLEELFEDYEYYHYDKFMNSIEFINYCYDLIQTDILNYLKYGEEWDNLSESDFRYHFKNWGDVDGLQEMYSLNFIDDDVEDIYKKYTEMFNKYKKEGDVIKPMFITDEILFNNIELVNRI